MGSVFFWSPGIVHFLYHCNCSFCKIDSCHSHILSQDHQYEMQTALSRFGLWKLILFPMTITQLGDWIKWSPLSQSLRISLISGVLFGHVTRQTGESTSFMNRTSEAIVVVILLLSSRLNGASLHYLADLRRVSPFYLYAVRTCNHVPWTHCDFVIAWKGNSVPSS